MLSPEDIRRRAVSRYQEFLRSIVTEQSFFPLAIRFGKPSATEDFQKLRREITDLTQANLGCHIEWSEVNSRRWGRQSLPERVEFINEASYLHAIGKTKEVARFRENLALTQALCPTLVSCLNARPLDAIEFSDSWSGLIEVCCYFQKHPRPNLYSREPPLSVDTKFVERHQPILTRLLTAALPQEVIVETGRFEERFGLRLEEPLIRFRLLDEILRERLTIPFDDLSLPASSFCALDWCGVQLIIVENKKTFLTLPHQPNAVGIWGAGNAAALLHKIPWLAQCNLIYWGDLDAQGFEILARLRTAFPQTKSVMMDEQTLTRFRRPCGKGVPTKVQAKSVLTPSEAAAYALVRAENLRLEQEQIPHAYALDTIRMIA